MRVKRNMGIGVGGPSILMIFVVLALTTFAALSLVSARADYAFTVKTGEAVRAYYAADEQAQERLAAIDAVLAGLAEDSPDSEAYYAAAVDAMYRDADVRITEQDNVALVLTIAYTVPVDAERELRVALKINPRGDHPRYSVAEWRVCGLATGEYTDLGDGGFDVWMPDAQ